jgi:hypothetical protein
MHNFNDCHVRFKILISGWNCLPYLRRSLRSVAEEDDEKNYIGVVDLIE